MIPFWKKTDKHSKPQSAQKRRQNAKPAVPRTAHVRVFAENRAQNRAESKPKPPAP